MSSHALNECSINIYFLGSFAANLVTFCRFCRDNDVVNDPAVKQVVVEQTKQWSEMIERHRKENWELMKAHLQAQEEVLKKLMQAQQQLQIKELEFFIEK